MNYRHSNRPQGKYTHGLAQQKKGKELKNDGSIHGFWFYNFTFIHDKMKLEFSRPQEEANTRNADHPDPESPPKGTAPATDNVSTYNVENPDYTDQKRKSISRLDAMHCFCKNRKGIRGTCDLLCIDQHIPEVKKNVVMFGINDDMVSITWKCAKYPRTS